jgi:ribonuclease HII
MREYDALHPGYNFSRHVGYGTREHHEAIRLRGPCPIHRRSFRGVLPEGKDEG